MASTFYERSFHRVHVPSKICRAGERCGELTAIQRMLRAAFCFDGSNGCPKRRKWKGNVFWYYSVFGQRKSEKGKKKLRNDWKSFFFSWKGKRSELISSDFIHLKASLECLSADKMKHRMTKMSHIAPPIGVRRCRRHDVVVLQRGNERSPEWMAVSKCVQSVATCHQVTPRRDVLGS